MSDNKVPTVARLFNECDDDNTDLTLIDKYIIRCCTKKEDINTLFQYGSCPNDNMMYMTTLHVACYKGHHEIVNRLLEINNRFEVPINVNAISYIGDATPLYLACEQNCPLTVRALLQHPNIAINKSNFYGITPLHIACCRNRKEIVMELLKHPTIQVTVKHKSSGNIPLLEACRTNKDSTDIIQLLLDHQQQKFQNLQLNATNHSNKTPLHFACLHGNITAVIQLLSDHATMIDINATDRYGNTPLHDACSSSFYLQEEMSLTKEYHFNKEKICIIKNLLKEPSIRIYKKNKKNETPIDMCKHKPRSTASYTLNISLQKQFHEGIIQLFEDYYMEQRWQIYYFLIKSSLTKI